MPIDPDAINDGVEGFSEREWNIITNLKNF